MLLTYNQLDGEQDCRPKHETGPAAETVDNLSTDDCPNDADCVDAPRETILCDLTVPSLTEKNG